MRGLWQQEPKTGSFGCGLWTYPVWLWRQVNESLILLFVFHSVPFCSSCSLLLFLLLLLLLCTSSPVDLEGAVSSVGVASNGMCVMAATRTVSCEYLLYNEQQIWIKAHAYTVHVHSIASVREDCFFFWGRGNKINVCLFLLFFLDMAWRAETRVALHNIRNCPKHFL